MKKVKSFKLPPKAQLPLALVGVLLVGMLGYMMLVGPQRAKAIELQGQIDSTQAQVAANLVLQHQHVKPPTIQVADLFKLAKAMPDQEDMPEIILELNRIAGESGIGFESISRGLLTPATGYQTRKLDLAFTGNFYGLSDFLYRLRSLVSVRGGKLDASGRLFSVESLQFGPGDQDFPRISAKLTLDAYVYGAPAAAVTPATTTPSSTGTSTTPSSDTPPPAVPGGATAAGAANG